MPLHTALVDGRVPDVYPMARLDKLLLPGRHPCALSQPGFPLGGPRARSPALHTLGARCQPHRKSRCSVPMAHRQATRGHSYLRPRAGQGLGQS